MADLNSSQQRILKLVIVLFGDVVRGYQPGALARLVGCSPAHITRDMDNLVAAGLAERDEDGRCRLTPRLPQQAVKVYAALGRAEVQLREDRDRYTGTARQSDGVLFNPLTGERK